LPTSFSAERERLQRFAQEARAAAALNHPNILSIFDVGEEHGTVYLVSELLEGETLRDRLRSGPLPIRKAIEYAAQTMRGLAAAHDKGIVHRDLKPENLFLTHDGRLKILDFGLAKLTLPATQAESGDAPTVQAATEPGLVMGTVGYMAPEQVRGKPADARSDLFAFGAILYEMISGQRAFHGDSAADIMSSILKDDPAELTETNRNVSPALERIVRHCLEKNPAERFQSARDVAFNLEALSGISTSSRSAAMHAVPEKAVFRRWLVSLLAAGLLLASWVGVYAFARRGVHVMNPTFHQVTFRRGTIWAARFAPDGQTIVYGAAGSLHVALRQFRLAPGRPARFAGSCRFFERRVGGLVAPRGQQCLYTVGHLSPCPACRRRSARSVGRGGMGRLDRRWPVSRCYPPKRAGQPWAGTAAGESHL
jgi:hypothetical protein